LSLSISIFSISSASSRDTTDTELKEAGIDISIIGQLKGIELIDGRYSYGNREGSESLVRREHGLLFDKDRKLALPAATHGPLTMMVMRYIEVVGGIVSSSALGLPRVEKEPWMSAASNPPDRMYLDRFATALGNSDTSLLGDGGNGYVFGPEGMTEFLAQYRLIPAIKFDRLAVELDAIAVWQRNEMFYVVNMMPFLIEAKIKIDAGTKVNRADGRADVGVHDGELNVSLRPFELLVFRASGNDPVRHVDVHINEENLKELVMAIERLEEQAKNACQVRDDQRCGNLNKRSKEERSALSQRAFGTLWHLISLTDQQYIGSAH
jgi:hypothetical protein